MKDIVHRKNVAKSGSSSRTANFIATPLAEPMMPLATIAKYAIRLFLFMDLNRWWELGVMTFLEFFA